MTLSSESQQCLAAERSIGSIQLLTFAPHAPPALSAHPVQCAVYTVHTPQAPAAQCAHPMHRLHYLHTLYSVHCTPCRVHTHHKHLPHSVQRTLCTPHAPLPSIGFHCIEASSVDGGRDCSSRRLH